MPRKSKKKEIDDWIEFQEKRGRRFTPLVRNTCNEDGKKINIHFASPIEKGSNKGKFWFGIICDQLSDMDDFVFICGKTEDYYEIPCVELKKYEMWKHKQNPLCSFLIDKESHTYLLNKKEHEDIEKFSARSVD